MREIKFEFMVKDKTRGWCKEVFPLFDIERGYSTRWIKNNKFIFPQSGDLIVRRQFTGLLDKNGTEIYEGDIIKGDDLGNDAVVYEGNMFMLQPQNDDCVYWELCEVIGNIHENPELLEA